MLHPITYNTCLFSYILKYSMFTFDFPPFSPFVRQTRSDKNTINQEVSMAYGKVYLALETTQYDTILSDMNLNCTQKPM